MRHMSSKTINHNKEIQEEKADGDGIVFVFWGSDVWVWRSEKER